MIISVLFSGVQNGKELNVDNVLLSLVRLLRTQSLKLRLTYLQRMKAVDILRFLEIIDPNFIFEQQMVDFHKLDQANKEMQEELNELKLDAEELDHHSSIVGAAHRAIISTMRPSQQIYLDLI